jgi:hypothetical protein
MQLLVLLGMLLLSLPPRQGCRRAVQEPAVYPASVQPGYTCISCRHTVPCVQGTGYSECFSARVLLIFHTVLPGTGNGLRVVQQLQQPFCRPCRWHLQGLCLPFDFRQARLVVLLCSICRAYVRAAAILSQV